MQALKLKGNIDKFGKLQLLEAIDLTLGEVEIIILRVDEPGQKVDASDLVPAPLES